MQPNQENIYVNPNIDWEEVEYKIKIICNKFSTSVESRYIDDLAQELRIHAYYKSDDYYNLQRRAIDFWRSMRVNVMPEMPYFDLEVLGRSKMENFEDTDYQELVKLIDERLNTPLKGKYDNEIRALAIDIFSIIRSDIEEDAKVYFKDCEDVSPYHNSRISCNYLYNVLGEKPGDVKYARIRKAVKMLEGIIIDLDKNNIWKIDAKYLSGGDE